MKKIIIVLALLLAFGSLPTYEAANFGSFGSLTVSAFEIKEKEDDGINDSQNDQAAEPQQEEVEISNQTQETPATVNNTPSTDTGEMSGGSGGSDTSNSGSDSGKTNSPSGSNSGTSDKKKESEKTQDSPAEEGEKLEEEAEVIEDILETEMPATMGEQEMVTVEVSMESDDSGMSAFPVILIIISIILIALIIIFCILLGRKSKKPKSGAIFMKLEMISAKGEANKTEFFLEEELTIGRGKNCDVVIDSDDIEMKHSRIYVNNGIVYIEDLKSRSGTLLGGMRLYAPNRLRTGDEITIGSARFRLKF